MTDTVLETEESSRGREDKAKSACDTGDALATVGLRKLLAEALVGTTDPQGPLSAPIAGLSAGDASQKGGRLPYTSSALRERGGLRRSVKINGTVVGMSGRDAQLGLSLGAGSTFRFHRLPE
ncbi:hypothetical protein RvY_06341 [Ramazzottius varieornatus]|uniref:Uncharacterized protein n=1 Tax=Ramazzottius varieornatus TaxID=947166 RepID=A0A1D1UY92_RAMVA|nr:hypothetical protein RvY_06341 [Ramazzottius varieornatus]